MVVMYGIYVIANCVFALFRIKDNQKTEEGRERVRLANNTPLFSTILLANTAIPVYIIRRLMK